MEVFLESQSHSSHCSPEKKLHFPQQVTDKWHSRKSMLAGDCRLVQENRSKAIVSMQIFLRMLTSIEKVDIVFASFEKVEILFFLLLLIVFLSLSFFFQLKINLKLESDNSSVSFGFFIYSDNCIPSMRSLHFLRPRLPHLYKEGIELYQIFLNSKQL